MSFKGQVFYIFNQAKQNLINFQYLIVGGGGGGGVASGLQAGGGGGAGGMIAGEAEKEITTYSITVGNFGAVQNNGSDSSAFGFTAKGGGKGGDVNTNGSAGGSGGGAGAPSSFGPTYIGGTGESGQGNSGGDSSSTNGGAGGGGAGSSGQSSISTGGNGGSGLTSRIRTGATASYAAGGGGGGFAGGGSGGSSIGGNGANGQAGTNATIPTANTGSGGGGSTSTYTASRGAAGIVVIRYAGDEQKMWGGNTIREITEDGQKYIAHSYTSTGTRNFEPTDDITFVGHIGKTSNNADITFTTAELNALGAQSTDLILLVGVKGNGSTVAEINALQSGSNGGQSWSTPDQWSDETSSFNFLLSNNTNTNVNSEVRWARFNGTWSNLLQYRRSNNTGLTHCAIVMIFRGKNANWFMPNTSAATGSFRTITTSATGLTASPTTSMYQAVTTPEHIVIMLAAKARTTAGTIVEDANGGYTFIDSFSQDGADGNLRLRAYYWISKSRATPPTLSISSSNAGIVIGGFTMNRLAV